jgi:hypothetical protein
MTNQKAQARKSRLTNTEAQENQFEGRGFAVQKKSDTHTQKSDLNTLLLQAKTFGHSISKLAGQESSSASPQTSGLSIQAKLSIGEPGDRYEQEADRVALEVVQRINAPSSTEQSVQREVMPEEEDELQMKPLADAIQRVEDGEKEDLSIVLGEELKEGEEIGYKATVLPPDTEFKWPPPETDKNAQWSGIYCGSKTEAEGYMTPLVDDNTGRTLPSKGYLQLIKRNGKNDNVIKMVEVVGKYMASPDVGGDEKAGRVKALLDFPKEASLMTKLGDKLMIYRGASLIEGEGESINIMKETAIPHALASYFSAEIIKTTDFK